MRATPARQHGYCTDDVARALVVVLREPSLPAALGHLEATYLRFLERARLPDGRFHNRLAAGPRPRWNDDVGSDDTIGRALWAAGTAAARATTPALRRRALAVFEAAASFRSPSPRANAAAILGAVEVEQRHGANEAAQMLLARGAARLGSVASLPSWPWPEARLAYENARLPEARIAVGAALGDERLLREGIELLGWLVEVETRDGHFSFTPPQGWRPGEPRPAFDQQPVEAGAMADACARAFDVTGEPYWARECARAAEWFLGRNDIGAQLYDPATGGCRDGLGAAGCNENEGAESTVALISALQQARRVQAARNAVSSSAVSTSAAPTWRSAAPYVR